MKTTPNLGLRKPEQTDFYNVDDFNYNADVIDQELTEAKATAQQANQTANQTASDLAAHLNDKNNPHNVTPEQIGAETPAGAQSKAAAAEANAKNYADETKVSKAGDTMTGILTMDGSNAINFGGKFQIAYNPATNSLDITVVG